MRLHQLPMLPRVEGASSLYMMDRQESGRKLSWLPSKQIDLMAVSTVSVNKINLLLQTVNGRDTWFHNQPTVTLFHGTGPTPDMSIFPEVDSQQRTCLKNGQHELRTLHFFRRIRKYNFHLCYSPLGTSKFYKRGSFLIFITDSSDWDQSAVKTQSWATEQRKLTTSVPPAELRPLNLMNIQLKDASAEHAINKYKLNHVLINSGPTTHSLTSKP
jgi:hypothetical protein